MKTYYLTPKFKFLSLLSPTLIILLFFILWQSYLLFFSIFVLYLTYVTIKNMTNEHLTLSENGIEYHRFRLTFKTKWENVREISTRWFPPFEQEGIFLAADQFRLIEWSANSNELGAWGQWAFIPLSKFSDNWRESELGQKIKQYAPHLSI